MAVARALANEPPVILADEPTGSLDSHASEQVFELLRDLVERQGKTVVAVTHDLALAARMDRRDRAVGRRHHRRKDRQGAAGLTAPFGAAARSIDCIAGELGI